MPSPGCLHRTLIQAAHAFVFPNNGAVWRGGGAPFWTLGTFSFWSSLMRAAAIRALIAGRVHARPLQCLQVAHHAPVGPPRVFIASSFQGGSKGEPAPLVGSVASCTNGL